VGVVYFIAGLAKFGFIADFLSKPILVGYVAGTALIMIASQLGKMFGIDIESDKFFAQIWELLTHLDDTHTLTFAIGVACIAILLMIRRFMPKLPGPLVVVVGATLVSALFNLSERGVSVIGTIPSGLPQLQFPFGALPNVFDLILPAGALFLVTFADSILTGRIYATRNGYSLNTNQELYALGAANLGAGLFQGFPISSSGSRTALNDSMKGKTQLIQLMCAGFLIVFLLFFTWLLADLPNVALGAIIIVAAIGLIDVKSLVTLYKWRRIEFFVAITTLIGVLTVGILQGVIIAVVFSLLDLISRISRPHGSVLGPTQGIDGYQEIDAKGSSMAAPGLIIYRFEAPMFFANAQFFLDETSRLIDATPDLKCFILDEQAITTMDVTAVETLSQFHSNLKSKGITLEIARENSNVRKMMQNTHLEEEIGSENFYPTVRTAVQAYLQRAGLHKHAKGILEPISLDQMEDSPPPDLSGESTGTDEEALEDDLAPRI
jgi:SulP family sulfate permease